MYINLSIPTRCTFHWRICRPDKRVVKNSTLVQVKTNKHRLRHLIISTGSEPGGVRHLQELIPNTPWCWYIYIYLHIFTYIYIYLHIFTYIYIYLHIFTYIYIYLLYQMLHVWAYLPTKLGDLCWVNVDKSSTMEPSWEHLEGHRGFHGAFSGMLHLSMCWTITCQKPSVFFLSARRNWKQSIFDMAATTKVYTHVYI